MKLKALLFDLDGVLVQSEHLYAEAKKRTLHHYSIDTSLLDMTQYSGQTDKAFFLSMLEQFPFIKQSAEELARESDRIFRTELYMKMVPMPGAREIIQLASMAGLKIANVTSATGESQDFALTMLGAQEIISVRVNANNVTKFKPDPEPYLNAIRLLNEDPKECLVVEDTTSGIRSATAAGLKVAAFGMTFPEDELIQAGAAFYIKDYKELQEKLFL